MTTPATQQHPPQHFGPKARAKHNLSHKQHVEHLGTLTVIFLIETAISLELAYWAIAIIVAFAIYGRESTLIVFYAEENLLRGN